MKLPLTVQQQPYALTQYYWLIIEEDLEEVQKHMDTRAHRELDRQRDERDMDAELIAQRMKERYGRADHGRGTYRGDLDHIPQSMLMPSVNDPKLYLCQVRVCCLLTR